MLNFFFERTPRENIFNKSEAEKLLHAMENEKLMIFTRPRNPLPVTTHILVSECDMMHMCKDSQGVETA